MSINYLGIDDWQGRCVVVYWAYRAIAQMKHKNKEAPTMKTIKAKPLDHESFRPYGDFVQLIRPAELFEGRPVDFTPEML